MRKALTIRLDPETLAAAKRVAREDNRTLTNYIETLIQINLMQSKTAASQRKAHKKKKAG